MKLIFYKARYGAIGDKLIAWYTSNWKDKLNGNWRNSYSHVEILFSDGMMFSASQYENTVRYTRHSYSDSWDRIKLNISYDDECIVRSFCDSVEGAKYDYLGVAGFVLMNRDSRSKYFCSEVCVEALQEVGKLLKLDASKTSPNKLYKETT